MTKDVPAEASAGDDADLPYRVIWSRTADLDVFFEFKSMIPE